MPARKNEEQSSDAMETEAPVTGFDFLARRINLSYQGLISSALATSLTITDGLFNPDGTAKEDTYDQLSELARCILVAVKYGRDLQKTFTVHMESVLMPEMSEPEPEPETVEMPGLMVLRMPFPPFSGGGAYDGADEPFPPSATFSGGLSGFLPSGETIAQLFSALKANPFTNGSRDAALTTEEQDDAILKMAEAMGVDPSMLVGDDLRGFPVRTNDGHKGWVERWMGEQDYVIHFEDGTHHVYTRHEFTVSK